MTGYAKPDSLTSRVIAFVEQRGTATINDLVLAFPGADRRQLHNTLENGRTRRRLRVKVRGNPKAHIPSVWEPDDRPQTTRHQVPVKPIQPVPSVWAWGARSEWPGTWPPLSAGRAYAPLGGWDSEAA